VGVKHGNETAGGEKRRRALLADLHRATGGVGLGLTIARRAIKVEGGTLRLLNRAEGGLSVLISLPIEMDEKRAPSSHQGGTRTHRMSSEKPLIGCHARFWRRTDRTRNVGLPTARLLDHTPRSAPAPARPTSPAWWRPGPQTCGAVLRRPALHPPSVPLAGAHEERLVGLDHPGGGRRVVLRGSLEEAVSPAPDCSVVHPNPLRRTSPLLPEVPHYGRRYPNPAD
jgi:hypothetical protein